MDHQEEELSEMLMYQYCPATRYTMDHLMKDLSEMLTCQVCWEILTHPIFQCKFEHLLCQECFQKMRNCPSCQEQLEPNLRSLSMERLADILHIPCEYRSVGCPKLLQPKNKRRHEETCAFGPGASVVQCPLVDSCSWLGSRGTVEQHVRHDHRDKLVVTPDGAFSATAPSTVLLDFKSALFVLRAKSVTVADSTSHYVHLGHVTQGLHAAKARYRFKVRLDPDGASYKGYVTDYRQPLEELAATGGCLSFVTNVSETDKMSYSGAIKKLPIQVLIE